MRLMLKYKKKNEIKKAITLMAFYKWY